jgi:hypothetical protein
MEWRKRLRISSADALLVMVPVSCAVAVAIGVFLPRQTAYVPFKGALALGVGCGAAYVVYRAAVELKNWRGLLRYLSWWNLVLAAVPWLLMGAAFPLAIKFPRASWWLAGFGWTWVGLTLFGGWRGLWMGVVIGSMLIMVWLELLFLVEM